MTQVTTRTWREWISSFPVLILLLLVIAAGTSENIHSKFLQIGQAFWDDYFILRGDIPTPSCNPELNIEKELDRLQLEAEAASAEDELGLFDDTEFDREASRTSLTSQIQLCREKHALAAENQARVDGPVIIFRSIETVIAGVSMAVVSQQRLMMILMIFICAITASVTRHHISFRPIRTVMDHRISSTASFVGNAILTISAWSYRESVVNSGVIIEYPLILQLLIAGFAILTVISLYQLFSIPKDAEPGGNPLQSLLTIPLYIIMAFVAGNYFFLTESHGAGVAIFFSQLFEQSAMFLNIGLYIWIGMMLKQTRLAHLVFDVFKPWHLPAELLAFAAIVVMAVPTAFTGASGIIIIAMGVVVYEELRRAGARRQLALAATAMTGSSGVVLNPCLLVVIIAILNKEVTTTQLFDWGVWVFLLTVFVFFIVALITKKEKLSIAPASEAMGPCLDALKPLLPYALITAGVAILYAIFLDAYLDEFSAPIILPVIIMALVAYEKIFDKSEVEEVDDTKPKTFEGAMRQATTDATVHIGALIILMGLSFASGGVIERSGMFEEMVAGLGADVSIYVMMAYLIAALVFIGMIMDPFGAVVLVTGTVAAIAYQAGIHPLHFWMLTLVAFELGYLSPPVAINHLLTRQVVGEEEARLAGQEGESFWYRWERYLMPLLVMGVTLLLVAYVPLIYGYEYSQ